MGQRRDRFDRRMANQTSTRRENSLKKDRATDRRAKAMIKLIKEGTFPYTPPVMSWLSLEMGKRSALLTEAEVKAFIN